MAVHKTDTKKKALIEALRQSLGIVSQACESIGIHRSTYYDWLEKDPVFKQEIDSIQDTAIDFVEGKLFENIQENDVTSIIFYLKTKAKHRGYIERQDLKVTTDGVKSFVIEAASGGKTNKGK
jgi:hypothetical protein